MYRIVKYLLETSDGENDVGDEDGEGDVGDGDDEIAVYESSRRLFLRLQRLNF